MFSIIDISKNFENHENIDNTDNNITITTDITNVDIKGKNAIILSDEIETTIDKSIDRNHEKDTELKKSDLKNDINIETNKDILNNKSNVIIDKTISNSSDLFIKNKTIDNNDTILIIIIIIYLYSPLSLIILYPLYQKSFHLKKTNLPPHGYNE